MVARRGLSSHRMPQGAAALEIAKRQLSYPLESDAEGQERAPFRRGRQFAKGDSYCSGTSHSSQAARSGKQRRKGQRRRNKVRQGRDLHDAGPVRPRDRTRQFPRLQSVWPMFFALMSSFSREKEFTKFVSEEDRHSPFPSHCKAARIPMPAGPRRRARCDRHEARAEFVAFISCCLVRPSNGGPGPLSHCQRARSEVFAVVPLQRAAWTRWLSVVISEAAAKHCFSLCPTEHPFQIQNLSMFHATQRIGLTDKPPPSRLQKVSSPLASAFSLALQLYHCSIGFPDAWRTTSAIQRTPSRLVTTPHSLL